MKLFGKKDDAPTDAPELDSPDEGAGPADAEFGDPAQEQAPAPAAESGEAPAEEEGGELAAPARPVDSGGGKKKLLIGLGALVILGGLGGGGYFYFMGGSDTAMPPHPVPPKVAATPPAAAPATPAPAAAATPATPAAPVKTDVAAATPAAPPAASAPDSAMPPMPAPASATPPMPAPASATPALAATPPAAPAGLGAPPAEEATAMPLMPAAPAHPAAAAGAPPALEAPGEEPPADLPMPANATPAMPVAPAATATAPSTAAAMPAAAPAPDVKKATGKVKAAAGSGKGTEPSDAEKAIVQNAAVLDQLSSNAAPGTRPFDPNQAPPDQSKAMKTVDQLLEQPAIVRPLPPSWLTVKKERASDDVDTHLVVAREALAQNNNTAALHLFSDLAEKYPRDRRILMGRAVALQKLGQDDPALAAYEAVLNNDPKNLEALTNMLGLLKKKDPKLALEKLEQLREAYPYNADITAQLGIACGASGRYEEAMKYLDMADALNPGSAYVLYNKAVLYDKMGKSQQAGELYRQVIRLAADGQLDETLPLDAIKRRLAVLR